MKNTLSKKIIFTFVCVCIFCFNFSFAADGESSFMSFTFLHGLKDILNMLWLPFAIIAGKLYTNDFVYATFLGMDKLLWQIWQFSRTIANFAIGFIFILSIFMFLLGKTKNIFTTIGKIGIASVLVNASWFIIGVLIDISIILLVAVGAFPMSLLSDSDLKPIEKISYCPNMEIGVDLKNETKSKMSQLITCKDNKVKDAKTTDLMQNMNSMSGPLLFIGASILQLDKSLDLSPGEMKQNSDGDKSLEISFLIKLIIVCLFVIPIVILIILGVIRIFRIWIYIAFSPLIFLDQIFGGKMSEKTSQKAFKFKNMIGLIFQPVLVVFALGISLIFLATLQSAFVQNSGNGKDPAKEALGLCNGSSNSMCLDDKTIVTVEGNLNNSTIQQKSGGFLGFLILSILSIVILWSMIKLAFQSTEITQKVSDGVFEFAKQSAAAIPVIPTGHGKVGIGAMKIAMSNTSLVKGLQASSAKKADGLIEKINSTMGIQMNDISQSERVERDSKLHNIGSEGLGIAYLQEFINTTKKKYPNLIPSASPNFQYIVAGIINKIGAFNKTVYDELELKKDGKNITDPSEMFKSDKFKSTLSGFIMNTDALTGANFKQVVNKVKSESTANRLDTSISTIAKK